MTFVVLSYSYDDCGNDLSLFSVSSVAVFAVQSELYKP